MSVAIRLAEPGDFNFLRARDAHVAPEELRDVMKRGRVLVATCDGERVGWLRWSRSDT